MIQFEEAHQQFIQFHLDRRSGARRERLERGHGHGEKLFLKNEWWPLIGNFTNLHPEYEVLDWRGIPYYIDFAYILPFVKYGIEIKGFGPHVRDTDRAKYCYELNRESFLQSIGWRMLSFSYDDVKERPEVVKMLIKLNLAPFLAAQPPVERAVLIDNELIRLALNLNRPIRPIDVEQHFAINHRTAVRWLQQTCQKGWLRPDVSPSASGVRIVYYSVVREMLPYWM